MAKKQKKTTIADELKLAQQRIKVLEAAIHKHNTINMARKIVLDEGIE